MIIPIALDVTGYTLFPSMDPLQIDRYILQTATLQYLRWPAQNKRVRLGNFVYGKGVPIGRVPCIIFHIHYVKLTPEEAA